MDYYLGFIKLMNWSEWNEGKHPREFGSSIFGSTNQNTDFPSFFGMVRGDFIPRVECRGRQVGEWHVKCVHFLLYVFVVVV